MAHTMTAKNEQRSGNHFASYRRVSPPKAEAPSVSRAQTINLWSGTSTPRNPSLSPSKSSPGHGLAAPSPASPSPSATSYMFPSGPFTPASAQNDAAATKKIPPSAKNVLIKDGELIFNGVSMNANIQFTRHDAHWVAEFRFTLRSCLFQACTLPLTTSSTPFATKALAVSGAVLHMIDSDRSSIKDTKINKAQQARLDALISWAAQFIVLEPEAAAILAPLAGKRFLDLFAGTVHIALASQGAVGAGDMELDAEERKTYLTNQPGDYAMHDDIRTANVWPCRHHLRWISLLELQCGRRARRC